MAVLAWHTPIMFRCRSVYHIVSGIFHVPKSVSTSAQCSLCDSQSRPHHHTFVRLVTLLSFPFLGMCPGLGEIRPSLPCYVPKHFWYHGFRRVLYSRIAVEYSKYNGGVGACSSRPHVLTFCSRREPPSTGNESYNEDTHTRPSIVAGY